MYLHNVVSRMFVFSVCQPHKFLVATNSFVNEKFCFRIEYFLKNCVVYPFSIDSLQDSGNSIMNLVSLSFLAFKNTYSALEHSACRKSA